VNAQVLPEFAHRHLPSPSHVAHRSTNSPASYTAKDAGAYYVRIGAGRTDATGTYSIVVTTR